MSYDDCWHYFVWAVAGILFSSLCRKREAKRQKEIRWAREAPLSKEIFFASETKCAKELQGTMLKGAWLCTFSLMSQLIHWNCSPRENAWILCFLSSRYRYRGEIAKEMYVHLHRRTKSVEEPSSGLSPVWIVRRRG